MVPGKTSICILPLNIRHPLGDTPHNTAYHDPRCSSSFATNRGSRLHDTKAVRYGLQFCLYYICGMEVTSLSLKFELGEQDKLARGKSTTEGVDALLVRVSLRNDRRTVRTTGKETPPTN